MWMSMRLAAALDRAQADRAEACSPASARRWRSTGRASARRSSSSRRSNAMAATASSPTTSWSGSIARRRSTASGRAPATSSASMSCAPCSASRTRSRCLPRRVAQARGADARLDPFVDEVERRLADRQRFEPIARRIVEMMAFALQGSLLVRHSDTRLPMRSARPGSMETGAGLLAPCRTVLDTRRSWIAPASFPAEATTPTLRVGTSLAALSPIRLLGICDRPHAGRLCRTLTTAFA